MASPISLLYEPLISRDLEAVPKAVRQFRSTHAPLELFEAVTRFAILAFSPSQHSKHAVLACLAAYHLHGENGGDGFDELLTACAIYAAQSRAPWSEPPITDPPHLLPGEHSVRAMLDEAIAAGDRLKGERWLASRMHDPQFEGELLETGAEDLSDQGHKLIVAVAALQLARIMGEKGRFATLRLAILEWTSYREAVAELSPPTVSPRTLVGGLIERLTGSEGDSIAFHTLELYDAALTAASLGADRTVEMRVRAHLETEMATGSSETLTTEPEPPVYLLARDYAQYLLATAITRRMAMRFPSLDCQRIAQAALHNLKHGASFEDWSFA